MPYVPAVLFNRSAKIRYALRSEDEAPSVSSGAAAVDESACRCRAGGHRADGQLDRGGSFAGGHPPGLVADAQAVELVAGGDTGHGERVQHLGGQVIRVGRAGAPGRGWCCTRPLRR